MYPDSSLSKEQGDQKMCHIKNGGRIQWLKPDTSHQQSQLMSWFKTFIACVVFIFLNLNQMHIIRILPHGVGVRIKGFNSCTQLLKNFMRRTEGHQSTLECGKQKIKLNSHHVEKGFNLFCISTANKTKNHRFTLLKGKISGHYKEN